MKSRGQEKILWLLFLFLFALFGVVLIYMASNKISNGENVNATAYSYSTAVLNTDSGDIEIEFLPREAPKTVVNFITLAQNGFYNGTGFHRVIEDFMIQGGDPHSKSDNRALYGSGGPGYDFSDESNNVPMVRGVVAMANRGPHTNGSQFFIVTARATPWLEGKHTIFARVRSGMNVVDAISRAQTDASDIPLELVYVKDVRLQK